jgi:hypothetical protein
LAAGVNPNASTAHGSTPLHVAVCYNYVDIIALLLQHGASPNIRRSSDGGTALHVAAVFSPPHVIDLLLSAGGDANALDDRGQTPIVTLLRKDSGAASVETIGKLKAFLRAGTVDLDIRCDGKTAMEWVAPRSTMAQLLLDAHARPTKFDARQALSRIRFMDILPSRDAGSSVLGTGAFGTVSKALLRVRLCCHLHCLLATTKGPAQVGRWLTTPGCRVGILGSFKAIPSAPRALLP